MDNPQKRAAYGTQDEDKHNKNTKQKHKTICLGHTPANRNNVNNT